MIFYVDDSFGVGDFDDDCVWCDDFDDGMFILGVLDDVFVVLL